MIKAVLFDFDETLQDRTAAFLRYASAVLDEYYPLITAQEKEKRIGDMVRTGNGGYVDRVKWYSQLLDMWGCAAPPDAKTLAEHYDRNFGYYNVVFPDAVPTLKKLRERGIITGVITNGPSVLQHTKMNESGLLPYLDILVVSGDIEYRKPQPEIFQYTADKLGVKTGECIYVGDHPVNDISGALSAGMKPVRMNWGWFEGRELRGDVPVITSLSEVLSYV